MLERSLIAHSFIDETSDEVDLGSRERHDVTLHPLNTEISGGAQVDLVSAVRCIPLFYGSLPFGSAFGTLHWKSLLVFPTSCSPLEGFDTSRISIFQRLPSARQLLLLSQVSRTT
jgi:hypothetical protein